MAPNDLWCADFKGEFKLGNRQYCYPLTVTDQASRFQVCFGSHFALLPHSNSFPNPTS